MKPVIALVGRPNVGKSTLFNRLTKSRDAIVADFAGLTRDRHYGQGHLGKREYIVIDTGGFEPTAESGIFKEMAKQTRQAVAEADVVIFVVDARAGLSAQDHDIADYLRRLGKPCLLVANKAEGMREGAQLAEFYELGLGEVLPVSAAHGQGVRSMLEAALDALDLPEPEEDAEPDPDAPIRLAVAGRPNVGKSTLINTWLGEERLVAFDMPGTTRDAISVPFERAGKKFELIDTAGLRRKGKVFEAIEKFSVVKTPQTNLDCICLYNDLVSSTGHAVRHLHALGHRRIAFIGGSLQVGGSGARGQGFLAELRALGLPDDPAYHHEGGFDADSGERAVSRLLSGLERKEWPTALVAFNDLVALGAMRQLKQMGLRLPDDMAVIGCDNSFFCPYTDPPLTSMDLHADEHARSAIRELIVARDTDPKPFNIVRDATLVVRESCGAKLGYRKMG